MKIFPHFFRSALRSGAFSGLALGALLLGSAPAQDQARPDQIFVLDRTGEYKTVACMVKTDRIDEVTVDLRGRDKAYDSSKVNRVVFGTVPASYRDAQSYVTRGDYDNALRQWRLAADDAEAREPVRARARFEAAMVLMKRAAKSTDSAAFDEAIAEFDRFLGEFPTSRLVPRARRLAARSRLIAGQAQAAAELGAAVFDDLDGAGKNAYTTDLCFETGLEAARAFLTAGDSAAADALFQKIQTSLTSMTAEAEPDDRAQLELYSLRVVLGEGWRLLAEDKAGQAATFFQGKIRSGLPAALRDNARLGYAEGLLGQRKYREAQLEFAAVSGLNATSRDDVAQALVGLARCAQNLPDSDSPERIKNWLESCLTQYGDTPAARMARELLANL